MAVYDFGLLSYGDYQIVDETENDFYPGDYIDIPDDVDIPVPSFANLFDVITPKINATTQGIPYINSMTETTPTGTFADSISNMTMPFETSGNFTPVLSESSSSGENDDHGPDLVVVVLLLIVFIIGMIGNFLAIFVIVVLAEYKRVLTHWYVLQLAIADTIFLLTIPFRVAQDLNRDWSFPNWMCKASETMFFLNYYSSVSFLVLMSIDRYIAICHRFSIRLNKLRTQCATHFITSAVWISSILICIPVMMYTNPTGTLPNCRCEFMATDTYDEKRECAEEFPTTSSEFENCVEERSSLFYETCLTKVDKEIAHFNGTSFLNISTNTDSSPACHYRDRPSSFIAFIYINFIVLFIVPVIIMSVCYTLIAVRMRTSRLKSAYSSTRSKDSAIQNPVSRKKRSKSIVSIKDNRNRNRVTTMCVSLVLLFLFCWFPYHAVHMARMRGIEGETEQYCQNLFHVALLIAYFSVSSHSALNPCLYNFIGAKSHNRLSSAASSVRKSVKLRSTISKSSISTSMKYLSSKRSKRSIDANISNNVGGQFADQSSTDSTDRLKQLPVAVEAANSLSSLPAHDNDDTNIKESEPLKE